MSKEEIEKAKKILYLLSIGDFITWFTTDGCIEVEISSKTILEYIDQLESDKQKLIEKLEERIKAVDECYNELLTDVGGIKIINVTGLSKKEKEAIINKRNCLLVQKHCYQEILEILK